MVRLAYPARLARLSASRAGVTQLAECQLPKLNVAGSNPVSRSTSCSYTLARMVACPSCGTESPEGFRFCPACATPLAPSAAAPEERKVVTALFCDLIGFTATSERADPEDIDRMLSVYFNTARSQIEAHGGVVEKFIGDAVLGVFGVPAAHEDDPERAVRAALRICEDAELLRTPEGAPLRLRVGINTGEVLVRLGVVPASGE